METEYIKIYTGDFLTSQRIQQRLEDIGINAVVKNEDESARLAGFANPVPSLQDIYVHETELEKAKTVVDAIKNEI
ncbi:hypothetical protein FHS04_002276 [Mesoflavibacter sabulilitoris]|uniref:DUF2007 domain-containing protein n=1 Tax=Mesoflavibacter zeaxanthinifaciens subsp. sabulilitoris TaxID=1520893 RepID=A0A2T1NFE2_9FLAO|nr:DUF2007 domain-containing protein [Mesoflavibacter zeaxanthinifaciens]MBB3124749.1 hypothetical protein [Mesoflavibacter zeaxanthinifaciens subsp. sabulilitoris]PSG91155.1 hypothetical protein C7H61_07855 [Mesoflavibacter zeaxanthinifaciens subsp. sabulilitoris]